MSELCDIARLKNYLESQILYDTIDKDRTSNDICLVMEEGLHRQGKVGLFWLYSVNSEEEPRLGGNYVFSLYRLHERFLCTTEDFSWIVKQLNRKYGEKS
jgi:hypothetical protein